MKRMLLTVIMFTLSLPVFSNNETTAVEDTTTPSAHGPLDVNSISIPAEAMPKSNPNSLPKNSPPASTTPEVPTSNSSTLQPIMPATPGGSPEKNASQMNLSQPVSTPAQQNMSNTNAQP